MTKEKIEEAEKRLSTAKLLLENERFEAAVSRAYYSMFHAAKSLLQTEDSSPKTHEGVNSELGKLFRDRIDLELLREFSRIKQLREDADYGAESNISKQKATEVVETAEKFISRAKDITR
ncbi:HEPN domain-containing protein [Candidatus Nanohalobium constans]|uniref:HEPN domain-containing protein n=1 Tax=Candidatus Nanohalobium constans TaxID=2565781 RepID=A0A5Q0UHD7_9ARCH|nr:HEPN domain-containing protein [Candidatus Nanohalobium constans]QGA80365.1 HEPN domain-containing protein [Candidatus Nanohalobium constans]